MVFRLRCLLFALDNQGDPQHHHSPYSPSLKNEVGGLQFSLLLLAFVYL
jgi:hypothetical protein